MQSLFFLHEYLQPCPHDINLLNIFQYFKFKKSMLYNCNFALTNSALQIPSAYVTKFFHSFLSFSFQLVTLSLPYWMNMHEQLITKFNCENCWVIWITIYCHKNLGKFDGFRKWKRGKFIAIINLLILKFCVEFLMFK